MRILIADDSEDIRYLLQIYCKATEYRLTFAEDGERAVAAFESGFYDLIVMDVQMPLMDGLTAVRQIRQSESSGGRKRIPVLALTGNSAQQDVPVMLAAGYDAHLSKPVLKKAFLNLLEQWLPNGPAIQIPQGLEELAHTYLAKCRREVSNVRALLERSEFDAVRRLAHNLKGSGSSYGFPDITRLGANMERASSDENLTELSGHFAEMSAYIEAAHVHLESFALAAH